VMSAAVRVPVVIEGMHMHESNSTSQIQGLIQRACEVCHEHPWSCAVVKLYAATMGLTGTTIILNQAFMSDKSGVY
jgi:hypothetical protein